MNGEIAGGAEEVRASEPSSRRPDVRVEGGRPTVRDDVRVEGGRSRVSPDMRAESGRLDAPAGGGRRGARAQATPSDPRPIRVDAPPTDRADARPHPPREPLWRDVVGEVLREERQAKERTLQDVADAARISMPYLSEIERGRKEASSEMLAAATRALGISMTELLVRVRLRLIEYERAAAYPVGAAQAAAAANPTARIAPAARTAEAAYLAAGSATASRPAVTSDVKAMQSRNTLCLAA